jgi:hypothetical protein
MKLLGDKNQKASGNRILPPNRLRDIKTEVGEDTKALLRDAATSQKKDGKKEQTLKQISLSEVDEEQPQEKHVPQPEKDLPESQIIKVKKLPDMSSMIEVEDLEELQKVGKTSKFINCYEDTKQKTYFVSNYFYILDKKRQ